MNRDKGNIIFFIGVIVFVGALIVGYATDLSAVLVDVFMGLGLVIEFIGLCICYKKDKNQVIEKKEETKSLEEEKAKVKHEKHEDVVEVVKTEKKPVKKTTSKKEETNTSKKNTSNKKKNTKKSTTKKNNTKKSK